MNSWIGSVIVFQRLSRTDFVLWDVAHASASLPIVNIAFNQIARTGGSRPFGSLCPSRALNAEVNEAQCAHTTCSPI